MTRTPGTRIFALLSANKDEVRLIGRGEYLGDLPFGTAEDDVRLCFLSIKTASCSNNLRTWLKRDLLSVARFKT